MINKNGSLSIKLDIEGLSRDHGCSGKAIIIKNSECVSVAFRYSASNANAPYYIVIYGLSGSTMFYHIIS